MTSKDLLKSIIKYLAEKGFKFLRCLGEGSYGAVIAVRTPTDEVVAVKIVENHVIWKIEDEYWPLLRHANILPVFNALTIEELNVTLYFMPKHPNDLFSTIFKKDFRSDPNSFNRFKKWCQQILAAIEFLHFSGLCHLDIKSDNVLLDSDDNAVLCDFSGLNFTSFPINRICSPLAFRPKECFPIEDKKYIKGQSFDMWTYGFLVLTLLTDHYPQSRMSHLQDIIPDWEQIWPILEESLKESTFERQIRKAFPCADFSKRDIHEALHFVKFILNIQPDKRPSASRAKMHPFLKIDTNPFAKDLKEDFCKNTDGINPFRRNLDIVDRKNHGAIPKSNVSKKYTEMQRNETVPNNEAKSNDIDTVKENPKRKTLGKKVKNWFKKQYNKVFKVKK